MFPPPPLLVAFVQTYRFLVASSELYVQTPFLQFFNQLSYPTLKYSICVGKEQKKKKKKKTWENFFAGFIPL